MFKFHIIYQVQCQSVDPKVCLCEVCMYKKSSGSFNKSVKYKSPYYVRPNDRTIKLMCPYERTPPYRDHLLLREQLPLPKFSNKPSSYRSTKTAFLQCGTTIKIILIAQYSTCKRHNQKNTTTPAYTAIIRYSMDRVFWPQDLHSMFNFSEREVCKCRISISKFPSQ